MNGKYITRSIFFFAVINFLLLASLSASAEVLVQVKPQLNVDVLELYPTEIGVMEIHLTNASDSPVRSFALDVHAGEGLEIIEQGTVLTSKLFSVPLLTPGQEYALNFDVRAHTDALLQTPPASPLESRQVLLNVNYGVSDFTQFAGTVVRVIPSPVQYEVQVPPLPHAKGEFIPVTFSIENISTQPISNELISNERISNARIDFSDFPSFMDVNVPFIAAGILASGDSFHETAGFIAEPYAQGQASGIAELSFTDSKGMHILQTPIVFEFSEPMSKLYYLGIALALVLLMYLVWMRSKQKPSPAGQPVSESHETDMSAETEEEIGDDVDAGEEDFDGERRSADHGKGHH